MSDIDIVHQVSYDKWIIKLYEGDKMLKFVICDDNQNTINHISIMLESIFIKNDLDAEIVFKCRLHKKICFLYLFYILLN